MSDPVRIHWTNVNIYCSEGGEVRYPPSGNLEEFQVRIMSEYRRNGSISNYYLADPAGWNMEDGTDEDGTDENGNIDLCSAGPRVSEIDWTGLDEAIEKLAAE